MKYLFLLVFPICLFSQNKPLSFEIDRITAIDSSASKRIYSLEYHIRNTSDKPVTFVLNATALIPINSGSQSEKMYFKLFENQTAIDMEIFESTFKKRIISSTVYEKDNLAEIEKIQREESLKFWNEENRKSIMDHIVKLAPNETRNYKTNLYWNRERYRKKGDIEYYIHETNPHFLELAFNLLLEVFEKKLSAEEYKILASDPAFIKGWYTSNRVAIDFTE